MTTLFLAHDLHQCQDSDQRLAVVELLQNLLLNGWLLLWRVEQFLLLFGWLLFSLLSLLTLFRHFLKHFLFCFQPSWLEVITNLVYLLFLLIFWLHTLVILLTWFSSLLYFFLFLFLLLFTTWLKHSDSHVILRLVLSVEILPQLTSPLFGFHIVLWHHFVPKILCYFAMIVHLIWGFHWFLAKEKWEQAHW